MIPPINLLPTFYLDADVLNVAPVCPGCKRMGLGLDLPGQPTVHVSITRGARAVFARQATRRFSGPSPNMGSILGQLSGTRARTLRTDGPNAACSAELVAFHLAYTCQPDALDKQVFDLYYVHRVAPVKVAASALKISRKHFYSVLGDFRKRLYFAAQSILAERMGP